MQQKTTMYANDGKTVIATLFDQNRQVIPLNQVPKSVTNALIATEDRRFYSHHGVDMRGLLRGALKTTNGDTQGASTLTEQYVKQVRYYEASTDAERAAAIDQNIDRKILDAQCALKIETQNTKAEILQKYLNIAFFGENCLWNPNRRPDLLRGQRQQADDSPGGDAGRPGQGAVGLRPVRAPAGRPGPA